MLGTCPPPTRHQDVSPCKHIVRQKDIPIAMSRSGFHSAIFAALARMRLWTSLYVMRRCSGSCSDIAMRDCCNRGVSGRRKGTLDSKDVHFGHESSG